MEERRAGDLQSEHLQPQELRSTVGPLISEFGHTLSRECPPFLYALAEYHFGGGAGMIPFYATREQIGTRVRFEGAHPGNELDGSLWQVAYGYTLGEQRLTLRRRTVDSEERRIVEVLDMNGGRFLDDLGDPEPSPLLTEDVRQAQAEVSSHIVYRRWDVTGIANEDVLSASNGKILEDLVDTQSAVSQANVLMGDLMAYGLGKREKDDNFS